MFFIIVQRINALVWMSFGLVMAFASDLLNILFATQYPWLTAPLGWLLLAYTGWLLLMGGRAAKMARPLKVLVTVNYGWSLLVILLISTGQIIVAPLGIRIAMVTALFTAAIGSLLFRHYKQLMGKY
jgi:hypothetical protein